MIADLAQIRELLAGDVDELTIAHEPPKVGTVQPVQPAVGKRAKCRVLVVDTWPLHAGGHSVRVEVVPIPHRPRLLAPARTGNYTGDANRALGGTADAGEAVPRDYQDRLVADARLSSVVENERRERAWRERDLIERIEDEITEGERLGLDMRRAYARLESLVNAIRARNARERAQRHRARQGGKAA